MNPSFFPLCVRPLKPYIHISTYDLFCTCLVLLYANISPIALQPMNQVNHTTRKKQHQDPQNVGSPPVNKGEEEPGGCRVDHSPCDSSPLNPAEFGGLAAAARSRIPLICLTTCSSVSHTFHSPIPMPIASASSLPVLFLYCISLSTKRPALRWISLSPTRRRIARRI